MTWRLDCSVVGRAENSDSERASACSATSSMAAWNSLGSIRSRNLKLEKVGFCGAVGKGEDEDD